MTIVLLVWCFVKFAFFVNMFFFCYVTEFVNIVTASFFPICCRDLSFLCFRFHFCMYSLFFLFKLRIDRDTKWQINDEAIIKRKQIQIFWKIMFVCVARQNAMHFDNETNRFIFDGLKAPLSFHSQWSYSRFNYAKYSHLNISLTQEQKQNKKKTRVYF